MDGILKCEKGAELVEKYLLCLETLGLQSQTKVLARAKDRSKKADERGPEASLSIESVHRLVLSIN